MAKKKKPWLLERTGILGYLEVPRIVWMVILIADIAIPDPIFLGDEALLFWLAIKKGK